MSKEEAVRFYETKEAEFPDRSIREAERVASVKGYRQKVDEPHRRYGSASGYRS